MTERQEARRAANRQRMLAVREHVEKEESAKAELAAAKGGEAPPGLSEDGKMYKITSLLFSNGYINGDEATKLNNQITRREIVTVDDMFNALDQFTKVFIREPLDGSVERVINEFGTYQPCNNFPAGDLIV